MSGATAYAKRIAKRLGYTNTFLHKAPSLDITGPGQEWLGQCDFVMSSDVFEHVVPPISRAFKNTLQILKPGGIFVLTVPYTLTGETREHFPELHRYQVLSRKGKRVLVNMTNEGKVQEFDQLVFHGGEGETLEMRVFSETGLLRELEQAGFADIRIHREPFRQFGIIWHQQWSLPITARRPR
jgi:SAM-dependent methyltransferase